MEPRPVQWRPPIDEHYTRQAPLSEIDLHTHLVRMGSIDYVFRKSMQHEIQVRPGEVPEQGRNDADTAEDRRVMIGVVTARYIFVWMLCSVFLDGDESVL